MESLNFYAHGKLLLSGEYFVLDGAKALAVPTRLGQWLEVYDGNSKDGMLLWESLDEKGQLVLTVTFELNDFNLIEKKGDLPHYLLQDALRAARNIRKDFLKHGRCIHAVSRLEFSWGWGLGSSSTLLHNIASWAKVDPFDLFFSVLQGSGYDIACAGASKPLVYQLSNSHAVWDEIDFHPSFADRLFFVYLGKKQNSQQAVREYRDRHHPDEVIHQITRITEQMIVSKDAADFMSLMKTHEDILSSTLRLDKVQDSLFPDFPGAVKSLGAWGGDFVMALSNEKPESTGHYFRNKGHATIFPFGEMLFKTF